ncbi:MAG: ABC transporter permease [Clostridiales bacterium]|nr:MAG: ABC transporter permease [Clostridiales bacterium]
MKQRALVKDTAREIWRTKSRFISIFAIILLGVGFFAGLKSTCPDMKLTAEEYFRNSHLMDYRLVSTYGFDEDDVANIRALEGVHAVMPAYSHDFLLLDGENELVMKTYSVNGSVSSDDENNLNRPNLVEGRYPEKSGECVVERGASSPKYFEVGGQITLYSGDDTPVGDTLKTDTFTIVGIVESPLYISYERGTSTIGNGSINSFIMLPEEDYNLEVYTDLYVTLDETQEISPFTDAYRDAVDNFSDSLKTAAFESVCTRYDSIVSEAEQELADARQKLAVGEQKQKDELAAAQKKIQDGEHKYNDGLRQYNEQYQLFQDTIADSRAQITAAEEQLNQQAAEFESANTLYQSLVNLRETAQPGVPFTEEQQAVAEASAALDENLPQLVLAALLTGDPTMLQMLDSALAQTAEGLNQASQALTNAREQLAKQTALLNQKESEGEQTFAETKTQLEQAKQDLQQAKIDFDEGKRESDAELADAREQIAKGEKDLEKISEPTVYVFDRDDNVGYSGFSSDADKVDAVAQIFPVFFIFVAALVCLTTMTRMVEEQRTTIGTLKALGYSKASVAMKYLAYAVIASFAGSVIGLLAGFQIFPHVIYSAYGILYHMPPLIAPFHWDYAVWCTVAAVVCSGAATLIACYAELHATPAQLMRPKPPKSGKRILLERVGWLWKRLSFIQKVSIRNFFRYKKRVILTVTGIAGCTALMLTGFGMKDSISSIVTKQFDEIFLYDVTVAYDGDVSGDERQSLLDTISDQPAVTEAMGAQQLSVTGVGSSRNVDCYLVIPQSTNALDHYMNLRSRGSNTPQPLTDNGVVVTEKLANMLGLSVGDNISLKDTDGEMVEAPITGIAENYLFHYVYMTPAVYESLYGETSAPNVVFLNLNTEEQAACDALSSAILQDDNVLQVSFSSSSGGSFRDMIESLNAVILVLILSAGALALIVLYNLTNINVNERVRELATLKVLGFYDKEVSAYIYRENTASSILGVLVGLVVGIFLHRFVVLTAEVDLVMFSREIFPMSYVWAALLTLAFTLLVNFLLHFRLKKIDMVESLKSVE